MNTNPASQGIGRGVSTQPSSSSPSHDEGGSAPVPTTSPVLAIDSQSSPVIELTDSLVSSTNPVRTQPVSPRIDDYQDILKQVVSSSAQGSLSGTTASVSELTPTLAPASPLIADDKPAVSSTATVVIPEDVQLDVLEQVLNEVEAEAVATQPSAPSLVAPNTMAVPVEPSAQVVHPVVQAMVPAAEDQEASSLYDGLATAVQPATPSVPNQVTSSSSYDPTQPSILPTVLPTVVEQTTNTLNPAYPSGSAKEALETGATVEVGAIDVAGGGQIIEQLRTPENPEVPVEVENFLQKVENYQDQLPTEIVIADGHTTPPAQHYVKTPVVVLPITADIEKEGERKGAQWSVKWLVEWSHKIMKMFTGKVIYRQETA